MIDSLPERPLSYHEKESLSQQCEMFITLVFAQNTDQNVYAFLLGDPNTERNHLVAWAEDETAWRRIETFTPPLPQWEVVEEAIYTFFRHHEPETESSLVLFNPEQGEPKRFTLDGQ
ncbi:hypothetical protein [Halocatena marina]|uniref:hypothetical protein n=1 Tax=Halocatena marina TaxID=2934937 RepID=UPI00200C40A7|nr:hypothetical protein [Halocatena marina]